MRHHESATAVLVVGPLAMLTLVIGLCLASTSARNRSDAAFGTLLSRFLVTSTVTPPVSVVATDTHTPEPDATPEPTVTATVTPQAAGPPEPYYGLHFVPADELGTVRELGVDVILMSFPHRGHPEEWLTYLDAAWAKQMHVIAWLWPEGWRWDGATWEIDEQAELFVWTMSAHPAVLAVYALHEPYWNGCWGCGYTTAEQQALYSAIKAIADVPIHSAVDSMSAWTSYAEEYDMDTAFADGICDYCETWYHCFRADGTYERDRVISQLEADLAVARERAPSSKVVWSMQSFAQEGHFRMPTAAEMEDLASIVYSRDIDGALWYPWRFGDLYSDFLFNHPELQDTVRRIDEDYVVPSRSRRDGVGTSD